MANKNFRIQVLAVAQNDVIEAIKWYEDIDHKLSSRLKQEIKSGYRAIAGNPFGFQIRYDSIRLYHLRIFPYSIHYEFSKPEKSIKILAFLHQHQKVKA